MTEEQSQQIQENNEPEPLLVKGEEDIDSITAAIKTYLEKHDVEVKFNLLPKSAFAANCKADGPGLNEGEVNIPSDFKIAAFDNKGNPLDHGDSPFTVEVKPQDGGEAVPAEIKDNGDGTYDVTFTPTSAGPHDVTVLLNGEPIGPEGGVTSVVDIAPATPDPAQCYAEGEGLEKAVVGQPAAAKVYSVNKNGDRIPVGGHDFAGLLKDANGREIPAEVKDNGDGTYDLSYVPVVAGPAELAITVLEGQPIKDSPFAVTVAKDAAKPDAEKCLVYGPGVGDAPDEAKGEVPVDTANPATFTIAACDPEGNKVAVGGAPFDAFVADADGNEVPVEIKDNGDGTYTGSYEPKRPVEHTVNVVLRNEAEPLYYEDVAKSPYKVPVAPGIDASKCVIDGEGVEDGMVENVHPTQFTIHAKDINGDDIKKGGEKFDVAVKGPDGKPIKKDPEVKDNGDGTYTVEYAPEEAGPHVVEVTLKGEPVAASPYNIEVEEGADEEETTVGHYGFTIIARDRFGEPMTTGGAKVDVEIKLDAPEAEPIEGISVVDNGDGTYTSEYDIEEPGEYIISIKINNRRLKGTPFKQILTPPKPPKN